MEAVFFIYLAAWLFCSATGQIIFHQSIINQQKTLWLGAGLFYILGFFIQWMAYQQGIAASRLIPFFNFNLLILLMYAKLRLHESLSLRQSIGILCFILGGVFTLY